MNKPKLLLADEPTGNLDSTNAHSIFDMFEKLRNEFGTTVIVVTHDQSLASRADRIVRLSDGVIV
jgi:ABC-type lipoprotein export system ATPase subunit